MGNNLKFVLIGCGRIGERHAEQITKTGKFLAVCDMDKSRADEMAQRYKVNAYYSIDDLLLHEKEANIISVCTPNGLHAEHCIKSLQAGKHVLCEKPLCITGAAARQIMETMKYCRRKLFVVKSGRYIPALLQAKNWISNGHAGKIYNFHLSCLWNRPVSYYENNWHGTIFPDGGTLYTQFSHYIDVMLWLLGDMEEVNGFRKNNAHTNVMEFEDDGAAAIKMKNGTIGTLNWSVNTFLKNMEISLTIVAEHGTLKIGGEYMNKIEYLCTRNDSDFHIPEMPLLHETSRPTMSNHQHVYENLAKVLMDDKHPFPTVLDGVKTVEAIEMIYQKINLQ